MDLLQELEFRELLYQVTDRDGLSQRLNDRPLTLYIGFDPTSDSLHVGSLLQILILRRFQLAGHHPIGIVGGGTGLIGDPSGKANERQLNAKETVDDWTQKIREQLERFLDFDTPVNPARVVSNYDWLGPLPLIDFLRDIGKHFSLGAMLAKESVKTRLEAGISFTEFSYMILQAYDFLRLFQDHGCQLQAGGSDQWGNITAGVDLIRRITGETAYGLTMPLVTKADGAKFGKTESGTIWLDPHKTTPYQFYQFWINMDDQDVVRFLKYYTFLSPEEITALAQEVVKRPSERTAQRTLAREVTSLVHGRQAMRSAENISQALFYGKVTELSAREIEQGLNDVPSYTLEGDRAVSLVDLLAKAAISPSKRRAREDIQNGAITVNDQRIADPGRLLTPADRLAGRYIVIRRGKNKYHLVKWLV
ncbi:MAG: tyrosine--tRNA ligase [Chloroflexi bacterium]|nr:tyrosine--tRNA ligase [Chloroflexota bacterium]MCI0648605.1 tyrosine--tRNA ligase [Chloroflexota bacterium]MCI0725450.1 tyrosine--tRNA ligase [Chloroflexota bacterium]